jgi:hypothetical protein
MTLESVCGRPAHFAGLYRTAIPKAVRRWRKNLVSDQAALSAVVKLNS